LTFNARLSKFSKPFKESFMALSFNLFGIVAGTTVAFYLGLFEITPWAIATYPAMLSARGVIGGLLSGRLSTALHLGTVKPHFLGNTKSFYTLIHAIVMLTLETSILMSAVAAIFGSFLWGATVADFVYILSVISATMAFSLIIITPLTVTVSSLSFRHGLDPDVILYPIESTVSDILITLCYFLVLNLFFVYDPIGRYLVALLDLALLFTIVYFLPRNIRNTDFVATVKEAILTLVLVALIVNVTGSVLSKIRETVGDRREIYTAYPALIDTIGDVGAVVGSTATTKLALGTLRSSFSSIRNHSTEIFGVWSASIIMFSVYSVLSLVIQGIFTLNTFLRFTSVLFATNLMATSSIIVVSFAVAILTFQKGLDPDNFVIPVESSLADGITTIFLLTALILIG
jgi:mgtE-like transporter